MQLRPYQQRAFEKIKKRRSEGVTRQLVVHATGLGKTVTFSNMPGELGLQNRMLVMVHREELAQQAAEKIQQWNPNLSVGIEMADNEASNHDDIIVASVQTLYSGGYKRLEKLLSKKFDLVVPDEAHHYTSKAYAETILRTLNKNPQALLVGFTATPNRSDGQGLNAIFEEIVDEYGMFPAIKDGWLVEPRGFRITTDANLDDVHTSMGDFQNNELSKAVNTAARNDLIVRKWLAQGQDRQTVAFTVDIEHAKNLADSFKRYGVAAEAIWGNDPDRQEKLQQHKRGGLRVLTNCNVLTEGYDDPQLGCVVLARPTKSQLLYVQMVGRSTRLPAGINNLLEARAAGLPIIKEDSLVFDVVDNTIRHSLVSLASLCGLPPKADLKGKGVVQTVQRVEAALAKAPNADLSKLEDIDKLEALVQNVNLFEVRFPQEVLDHSELAWHPTPGGNYVLMLPDKERVRLMKDLLDNWVIEGKVNGNEFSDKRSDLKSAFQFADKMVKFLGSRAHNIARREAKSKNSSKNGPVTEKQKNAIYWICRRKGIKMPDFSAMTSGEASMFIGRSGAQ